MKICALFLVCFIITYCNGFTLNDCTKDSDCVDGCCKPIGSEVLGYSACMTYIHVNHRCHLNHRDLTSCGCVKGSVCAPSSKLLFPGYGVCKPTT